eukprot:m.52992 g.52992  ORF g.52992 m.52992 type:complete len:435 (+) comp12746_c1_seq1:3487-4791(+)
MTNKMVIRIKTKATLAENLGDNASSNSLVTFTNCESLTLLERNIGDEFNLAACVLTGHHHLALRELDCASDITSAGKHLRTVTIDKRSVTTTFFFAQNVELCLELAVGFDGTGLAHDLTLADVFALQTAAKSTKVITCLTLRQLLLEHFDASNSGLNSLAVADDFNFITLANDTTLNLASHDSTTSRDRESVFDRHEERLIQVTHGVRDPGVNGGHESGDGILAKRVVTAFKGAQCRARNNRGVIAIVAIAGKQLTNLHLDKFKKFGIINHVSLVDVDDEVLNTDLLGQQNVLAGLRHLTIGSTYDENSTIHLSGTSNHVLDVIGVTRAIDVSIVALVSFILDMSGRDGDTSHTLFGSFIDIAVTLELSLALFREDLGDGSSQSSFSVIDVSNCTNIDVWFLTNELSSTTNSGENISSAERRCKLARGQLQQRA